MPRSTSSTMLSCMSSLESPPPLDTKFLSRQICATANNSVPVPQAGSHTRNFAISLRSDQSTASLVKARRASSMAAGVLV